MMAAEIGPHSEGVAVFKDVSTESGVSTTTSSSSASSFSGRPRNIELPANKAESTELGSGSAGNHKQSQQATGDTQDTKASRIGAGRQSRRYYIDELGFYRHLDPDQRQYVCSNLNDMRPAQNQAAQSNSSNSPHRMQDKGNSRYISLIGDGGFENCCRVIRDDLGISHFDRLVGYEKWKQDWDEFIRDKLLKRETVTLNQTLKLKVRTGIPHDYRRKVWTALIIMRTRNLRAQFGYDIYENLLRDYVYQIGIPKYDSVNEHGRCKDEEENESSSRSLDSTDLQQKNPFKTSGGFSDSNNNNNSSSNSNNNGSNNSSDRRRTFEVNLSKQAAEKIFKQIELDLLRTLPNNRHFEDPNSKGVKRVRRVLRAYACFNPAIGYCQGMNRLAAMALLVLPEEEAFWCLVAIIQCIMPKDYYLKPWLAQVDCYVLGELLEKKMPKLHKHLVKNDIQLTLFTWFFTIFVDGFRPELMLRIWDCFLVEGDKVLFRVALAILYIAQDDLLGMNDISNMSSYLSQLVSTRKLDAELLFETFNAMNPLSSTTLEARRAFHRNRMALTLNE